MTDPIYTDTWTRMRRELAARVLIELSFVDLGGVGPDPERVADQALAYADALVRRLRDREDEERNAEMLAKVKVGK